MNIVKDEIYENCKTVEYEDGTGYVEYLGTEEEIEFKFEEEQVVNIDAIELNEKLDYLTTLVELQGGLI